MSLACQIDSKLRLVLQIDIKSKVFFSKLFLGLVLEIDMTFFRFNPDRYRFNIDWVKSRGNRDRCRFTGTRPKKEEIDVRMGILSLMQGAIAP